MNKNKQKRRILFQLTVGMMLSSILDMLYPFGNKKKTDPRLNAGCLCLNLF